MFKRVLIVSGALVLALGGWVLANEEPSKSPKPGDDPTAACTAMMSSQGMTAEGRAQMKEFMQSQKMG